MELWDSCSLRGPSLRASLLLRTLTMRLKIIFATLLLTAAACTKKTARNDELRFRLPTDPPSIDWTMATDNISKEVISAIHEGLIEMNGDGKAENAMAESYSLSPDGKTYTFKLRDGIKWSDGKVVTAQHFVDSWERLLNPKTASEYAYFLFDLVNAEDYQKGAVKDFAQVGVKATDARTLTVTLRTPVAYWIYVPSFWVTFPLRKDVVDAKGDKWTDPENIVTAGPYLLKKFERDSRIALERNPNYYRQDVATQLVPKLEFRIVKDDATAVSLFNNGDLDVVRDLPPIQIQSLSKRPEFLASPFLRGYYIGLNKRDPTVADVKIRKALAHAIDRNELKQVLGALITPAKAWNQPGLLGYNPERGLDFNIELAKKYWNEAKTKPTTLEFWYDQRDLNKIVAENLQNQWKKNLGVEVRLTSQEWKVYLKTLDNKAPALWRLGWGADYPDPDTFLNLFKCQGGNNKTGFCDKTYDDLVTRAAAGTNEAERAKLYDQAEKIVLEDEVAIIPLFNQTNMHLVSAKVQGFKVNNMGDVQLKLLRVGGAVGQNTLGR